MTGKNGDFEKQKKRGTVTLIVPEDLSVLSDYCTLMHSNTRLGNGYHSIQKNRFLYTLHFFSLIGSSSPN
jgi:hypothetical protein